MTTNTALEAVGSELRDLFAKADDEGRINLQKHLRDWQNSFDTEWDTVCRLGSAPLQQSLFKIGTDLGVFRKLAESNTPLSVAFLAIDTGAAPRLLGHLLRAKAAFGYIQETGKDEFTANRTTKILADVNVAGAIHLIDLQGACAQALPAFLVGKNYQMITSNMDLPFQKAVHTDLTPFDWLKQNPEHMKSLGHAMAIQRPRNWVDEYPVETEIGSFSPAPDSALLVDIGGGFGQQAINFRNKFANLPGRIVVQDIAETLDRAPPANGIEYMAQDFFEPQPIQNAKFYYLRHILHDWTDEDCVKILKAIMPAMGVDSRIVIDEVVLPDTNVSWQAAYMDLTMMCSLGGVERTRTEYEKLLQLAGLEITDVYKYDTKMQSVILCKVTENN